MKKHLAKHGSETGQEARKPFSKSRAGLARRIARKAKQTARWAALEPQMDKESRV